MKLVNIKRLTTVRIAAFAFSLLWATVILFGAQTALAASPQCAVNTLKGTTKPQACSKKVDGIPENYRALLSKAPDNTCHLLVYNVSDASAAATPTHKEVPCSQEPFNGATQESIERQSDNFNKCQNDNGGSDECVTTYINTAINFLSVGVGVIVVIMIIIAGIQYSAAGGDAQKVAAAKTKIFNALLALLAFIFLSAFLQWIIPGGWFSK